MKTILASLFSLLALAACAQEKKMPTAKPAAPATTNAAVKTETATFAGGCFWCTDEVFKQQEGVVSVTSGYIGGHKANPTYKEVCAGTTGHAEATQVVFDPTKTSYETLLNVFWQAHDPTTLNRQGNDVGDQYRSVIFYHSPEQKKLAEASKEALGQSGAFKDPIVTFIQPASVFYAAEDYHQNYYELNKNKNPYCQYVVRPKLKKLGLKE